MISGGWEWHDLCVRNESLGRICFVIIMVNHIGIDVMCTTQRILGLHRPFTSRLCIVIMCKEKKKKTTTHHSQRICCYRFAKRGVEQKLVLHMYIRCVCIVVSLIFLSLSHMLANTNTRRTHRKKSQKKKKMTLVWIYISKWIELSLYRLFWWGHIFSLIF